MKYIAAYALLVLGGKETPSKYHSSDSLLMINRNTNHFHV